MNGRAWLGFGLLLACTGFGWPGAAVAEFEIAYQASAKGASDDTVSSYLGRELRSLGDVQITNDKQNADYFVHLRILKATNRGGHSTGYAGSFSIFEPQKVSTTMGIIQDLKPNWEKSGWNKKSIEKMFKGVGYYKGTLLYINGPDGLRKMIRDMVTSFDSNQLEEDRKLQRKIRE